MKLDLNDHSSLVTLATAAAGSFLRLSITSLKRGGERIELSVPRLKGESFSSFLASFEASKHLDFSEDGTVTGERPVKLSDAEKGFLRELFNGTDAAAAELSAEAGRFTLHSSPRSGAKWVITAHVVR